MVAKPTFDPADRVVPGRELLAYEVPSSLGSKDALIVRILRVLEAEACLGRADVDRVELALDEAIKNAMVHGNGLDPARRVRVRIAADGQRWSISIEDEGAGMRPEKVPAPLSPGDDLRESGFGIILIGDAFEDMVYAGRGNRLVLTRGRSAPDPESILRARQPIPVPRDEDVERSHFVPPAEGPIRMVDLETPRPARPVPAAGGDILEVRQVGGVPVVEILTPKLGDHNVEKLRAALLHVAETAPRMVIDLSRVEYVSSVVLGAFIGVIKRAAARRAKIAFACLSPRIVDLLDSTGIGKLVQAYPDVDSAVKG